MWPGSYFLQFFHIVVQKISIKKSLILTFCHKLLIINKRWMHHNAKSPGVLTILLALNVSKLSLIILIFSCVSINFDVFIWNFLEILCFVDIYPYLCTYLQTRRKFYGKIKFKTESFGDEDWGKDCCPCQGTCIHHNQILCIWPGFRNRQDIFHLQEQRGKDIHNHQKVIMASI